MKPRIISTIPNQRFYDVFGPSMRPLGWDGHACVSVIEDTGEVRVHEGFTLHAAMPHLSCNLDEAALRCVAVMRSPRHDFRYWTPVMWWDLAAHGIMPPPAKAKAPTLDDVEDAYLTQRNLF
jgi:hypothetical protein